jgi:signal transduction histidine kinase
LALINDLLDLAKLESGKATYDFAPTDLRMLAISAADEQSSRAEEKGVKLLVPKCPLDTRIVGDQMKLLQVFRNLLDNAIKFSPPGSVVKVLFQRKGDRIEAAVCDQGVGIPEEELEAIFDKFIQSSKTRTSAGGTGLGLAICREIITAHRGRIWAENRPDGGAVIRFEIPTDPRTDQSPEPPIPAASE